MNHIDTEWTIAEKTGQMKTWWVDTGTGKFVKMYTEALAKLVAERTGWKITPFD